MQTPVPEAALGFLCLHRLGEQQVKTWAKSGPHKIDAITWVCYLAQTPTVCPRSPNTWHVEVSTSDQLRLLCAVGCCASHHIHMLGVEVGAGYAAA